MIDYRRLAIVTAVTAYEKAVSDFSGPVILFWDVNGKCRAISSIIENLHWSVPKLDHEFKNYSLSVDLSKLILSPS